MEKLLATTNFNDLQNDLDWKDLVDILNLDNRYTYNSENSNQTNSNNSKSNATSVTLPHQIHYRHTTRENALEKINKIRLLKLLSAQQDLSDCNRTITDITLCPNIYYDYSLDTNNFDQITWPLSIRWPSDNRRSRNNNTTNNKGELDVDMLLRYSIDHILNLPHRTLLLKCIRISCIQKYYVILFWYMKVKLFESYDKSADTLTLSTLQRLLTLEYNRILLHLDSDSKAKLLTFLPLVLCNAVYYGYYYMIAGSRHLYTEAFRQNLYKCIVEVLYDINLAKSSIEMTFKNHIYEATLPSVRNTLPSIGSTKGSSRSKGAVAASTSRKGLPTGSTKGSSSSKGGCSSSSKGNSGSSKGRANDRLASRSGKGLQTSGSSKNRGDEQSSRSGKGLPDLAPTLSITSSTTATAGAAKRSTRLKTSFADSPSPSPSSTKQLARIPSAVKMESLIDDPKITASAAPLPLPTAANTNTLRSVNGNIPRSRSDGQLSLLSFVLPSEPNITNTSTTPQVPAPSIPVKLAPMLKRAKSQAAIDPTTATALHRQPFAKRLSALPILEPLSLLLSPNKNPMKRGVSFKTAPQPNDPNNHTSGNATTSSISSGDSSSDSSSSEPTPQLGVGVVVGVDGSSNRGGGLSHTSNQEESPRPSIGEGIEV